MRGAARVLALALGLCSQFHAAEAKKLSKPLNAAAKQKTDQLTEQGLSALKAGQFSDAVQAFVDGFRVSPLPKWLFHLAQVAAAEKKPVEARDLLRRFLADSTLEADDPLRKDAQTLLDSLPVVDAGEILVAGPRGAWLSVDGRFVGILPLSQPLLLPTGPHRVVASQDKWQAASEVKARLARQVELRFKSGSDVAVVTLPPAVLVIDKAPDPQSAEAVQKKVQTALGRESFAMVPRGAVETYAKDIANCLTDVACLRTAGQKFGVEFVLWTDTVKQGNGWKVEIHLRDAATGTELGRKTSECDSCTIEGLLPKIGESTGSLASNASSRDRGDLEVRSSPGGAEVLVDGQSLGTAPIKLSLLSGPYALVVRKPGYVDHTEQIEVKGGGPVVIDATLVDRDAQTEPSPVNKPDSLRLAVDQKRPKWRYAVGGAAIGVGAIFIGFGISAFVQNGVVLDGQCPASLGALRCQFGTVVPGIGLTVAGALIAGAGAGIIAWPPPKPRPQLSLWGTSSGVVLDLRY